MTLIIKTRGLPPRRLRPFLHVAVEDDFRSSENDGSDNEKVGDWGEEDDY